VMNGNVRGITNYIAPISNLIPSTQGHLLGATILGERVETDGQLGEIVKSEMRLWFPHHDVESWELLRGYRVVDAQMVQPPGFSTRLPGNESGIPDLYFAGEFTTNGSIDGAILSGLSCAESILGRVQAGAA
jgi:hypothetical protein